MNVEEIGLGMSEEQLEEKEERLIWRTERKGDGFAVPRSEKKVSSVKAATKQPLHFLSSPRVQITQHINQNQQAYFKVTNFL
ncbi:mCG21818 [Mus musculus]|nr:mCG21818 [Mus musculus]